MLPGAIHLRAVNPRCDEKLLIRNNQRQVQHAGGIAEWLMDLAVAQRSWERRMMLPRPSTSTQMTRPFCMNLNR